MKYRKIVSALMAAVLSVTGISGGTMLSASAETGAVRTDIVSGSEQLASSDNTFGSMLAADINEQQAQIQSGCVIYKAEMFGTAANVRFDTVQDGRIIVGLYEDPSKKDDRVPKLLGTGICDVTPEQKEAFVNIEGLDYMPDHYLIRAYLVSYSGALLSQEYENPMHTQEMEDLLGSDINAYAGYETLNLDDDDNTNFIVYSNDTTVLRTNGTENLVTEQDPDAGVYKISNYTGPTKTGDLVAIESGGNRITIFKIGSVKKSGSVTTIQADISFDPNAAFEYVKLETNSKNCETSYIPPENTDPETNIPITCEIVSEQNIQKRPVVLYADQNATSEAPSDDKVQKSDYLTYRFRFGDSAESENSIPFGKADEETGEKKERIDTAGIDINGGLEFTFAYDITCYGSPLFKQVDLNLDIDIKFTAECCLTAEVKIPLGSAIALNPCANLELHLGPYITASVTGKVTFTMMLKISYTSDSGFSFSGDVPGFELSAEGFLGIGVGGGLTYKDKGASLDIVAGFKAELSQADKHDGCSVCFDGTLSLECTATIKFDVWIAKFTGERSFGMELYKFYISNPLGFGAGECPNKNKQPGSDPNANPEGDPSQQPAEDDGLTDEQRAMFTFKDIGSGYIISLNAKKYGDTKNITKREELCKDITSLDMPDYYKGKPVSVIEKNAFRYCTNLQSVHFPKHLKTISERAFSNCSSLSDLPAFPGSVQSIEAFAFTETKIQKITLPSSMKTVPKSAFSRMYCLKHVTIPEGVTRINSFAFGYCMQLETVIMPSTLTEIGDRAFYNTDYLKIDLPDNLRRIGSNAFCGTDVRKYDIKPEYTLTIPDSLQYIGTGAFSWKANIKKLVLPRYYQNQIYDFSNLFRATEVELPENMTEIPARMFSGWSSLTEFKIPSTITKIGTSAFALSGLTEIIIPDTVKEIGAKAFYCCWWLKKVQLPSTISSIKDSTFFGCNSLETIDIPKSVTSIEIAAFGDCDSLKTLSIPSSVTYIDQIAFFANESLESMTIPASVQSMYFDAFWKCPKLKSVTFLNPNIQFLDEPEALVNSSSYDGKRWYFDKLTIYGYTGSTAETFAKENNFKFSALSGKPETPVTTTPGTTPQQPEEPKDEPLSITFTGLKPNTLYNFYDLLGTQFTAENLLYISQGVSDESGTLTVWYRPKADDTEAQKFVKCADPPPLYGDTNLDGFIDVADAVRLARYIAEDVTVEITDAGRRNGDCNHDGDISGDDCIMILMFIAKIITEI